MNHDDPKVGYALSVQARREAFARQLKDDTVLNQPHAPETEPRSWPLTHLVLVLFYLGLFVAAMAGAGRV